MRNRCLPAKEREGFSEASPRTQRMGKARKQRDQVTTQLTKSLPEYERRSSRPSPGNLASRRALKRPSAPSRRFDPRARMDRPSRTPFPLGAARSSSSNIYTNVIWNLFLCRHILGLPLLGSNDTLFFLLTFSQLTGSQLYSVLRTAIRHSHPTMNGSDPRHDDRKLAV